MDWVAYWRGQNGCSSPATKGLHGSMDNVQTGQNVIIFTKKFSLSFIPPFSWSTSTWSITEPFLEAEIVAQRFLTSIQKIAWDGILRPLG